MTLKICAIDLDGCLCQYPKAWVDFVNEKLDVADKFKDLNQIKEEISFKKYKDLKQQYRTSGIKATLPIIKGASEFTHRLKADGYMIIILTARPFYQIKEVFRDTLYWFKQNNIAHDLVFAGADKHIKILKYFEELEFMVEDNAGIANKVAKAGYKVYLVDNKYNQQKIEPNVIRIKKLSEVREDGKTKS